MRPRNIIILLIFLVALGGLYYFTHIPEPPKPQAPRYYAWDLSMDSIQHIRISLPREGKSESFIKVSTPDIFPWYFDDANHSAVDAKRWGGGITLLLSGPGVDRIISKSTPPEKMKEFGLTNPQMVIDMVLTGDNNTMSIQVGNKTPDGASYYVLAPNTNNDVALVDSSWHDVLANLVNDPPYASANTTPAKP